MADSTSPATQPIKPDPSAFALKIADAVTMIHKRFAGIRGQTHATSQGYADSYDDEAGMIFAGLAKEPAGLSSGTGDTSATVPPEVTLPLTPEILPRYPVTGASSQGDVMKPVYATDNQTLTLTRPSDDAEVVGVITKWHTSTTCDVLLFGLVGQLILGFAGGNRQILELGSYDNADLNDGDILTSFVLPFHGKLISLHGAVEKAFTGAGGTAQINAEIGGTNVTGGVVTVSTAASGTVGAIMAGTAITAENVFHEGDLLDLEVANQGGTQTAGRVRVYAIVERLPGA